MDSQHEGPTDRHDVVSVPHEVLSRFGPLIREEVSSVLRQATWPTSWKGTGMISTSVSLIGTTP